MMTMMAVETFVYIYIAAFAFAVIIGAALLVTAARYIARQDDEGKVQNAQRMEARTRMMTQAGKDI
jgi:dolichyl-phosphate-mannose--protein O-mannosyl transferase